MKLIICLDQLNGYCYNNRRQSKDITMRGHLISKIQPEQIYMSDYTKKSFVKDGYQYDYPSFISLDECDDDSWVFVEKEDVSGIIENVNEMIIYYWNRLYVSDKHLPADFIMKFEQVDKETFSGKSHKKIDYCRYVRK